MLDGLKKNLSVLKDEWITWLMAMKDNTDRFAYVGWLDKGQKSDYGEDNNWVGHLLQNYVTETIRALPRTLGYVVTGSAIFLTACWVIGLA